MKNFLCFFLLFLSSFGFSQECPFCGSLELNVSGVRSDKGVLRFILTSDEATFLEADPKKIDLQKIRYKNASIKNGSARIVFSSLKSGTYAYRIFHDENENEILDTSLMGKPLEGIAISGYRTITGEKHLFSKASFKLSSKQKIKKDLTLIYFISRIMSP